MAEICEEVIHYPSEDYPCLCYRLQLDDSGKICMQCGHAARKHSTTTSFSPPQRGEGAEGG